MKVARKEYWVPVNSVMYDVKCSCGAMFKNIKYITKEGNKEYWKFCPICGIRLLDDLLKMEDEDGDEVE